MFLRRKSYEAATALWAPPGTEAALGSLSTYPLIGVTDLLGYFGLSNPNDLWKNPIDDELEGFVAAVRDLLFRYSTMCSGSALKLAISTNIAFGSTDSTGT